MSNESNEITGAETVSGLKFNQNFTLASQEGKAGRPRKNGRAYVRAEEGTTMNLDTVRCAVASFYGKAAKEIQPYPHNTTEQCLAFIVPGLDRDLGATFTWR